MPWFLAKDNHIDIHDAQRLAFIARTVRRAASERNVPLHLMFLVRSNLRRQLLQLVES